MRDDIACVARRESGLAIVDVADPTNPVQIGEAPANAFAVHTVGNTAYVAGALGLQPVDVSDPTAPEALPAFPVAGLQRAIHVSGGFAYLPSGEVLLHIVHVGCAD